MDVCIALSTLGSDWNLGSPIVEHTPEEWASVRWFDSRPKPSWEELQAAWEIYKVQNPDMALAESVLMPEYAYHGYMGAALREMFPSAPPGSWKLTCGPETSWAISISEWNLAEPKPTQEQLNTACISAAMKSRIEEKRVEILTKSDDILTTFVSRYSENEKLSWAKQEKEALELLTNPDAPAKLLRRIATDRGISLDELRDKVLNNVAQSEVVTGSVLGQQQAFEDLLKLVQTVEDVDSIVVSYTIPDVTGVTYENV